MKWRYIEATKYFSEIIDVINATKYIYNMLLVRKNASDYSEYDIIIIDSKVYTINKYPIQIQCIYSVKNSEILLRKEKIFEEIDKIYYK